MKRIGEKRRLRNLVAAVSVGLIAGAFSMMPVAEALRGGVELPMLDAKGAAVTIEQTTEPGLNISSTVDNNIIKWVSFSIGSGGKVAFDSHNYLNYVTGHARSDILGTLTGGGSIYIVNPNGILIGDGAQVDVGSLYLSTRNLTTEQLAGFDTAAAALFKTDSLSGDVINMGKLNADVISVEGNNITFKNVADVTKNVVVDEEITDTAANDSVTLTAHGGGIHLGYAVETEATEVNASQYTDTQTPALNGWHLAGADPDYYMLVRNKYELQNMQNNLSGNYMLANTIDMSGVNFAPIGNDAGNYFRGNFNGLEHEIRNLCINADDTVMYVGLFGVNSGTIRNVGLVGGSITGTVNSDIGSIAGRNEKGTIENVFNTGTVKSINSDNGTVGGIVGSNYLGTIRNAYNTGAVTSSSLGGGIVGQNQGGTIENVFNTGAIAGVGTRNWLGGIVGQNGSAVIFDELQPGGDPQMNHRRVNGTITNAYNTGTVTSNSTSHSWVGGIAGMNSVYYPQPAPGEPPHIPDESSGNSNIKNVYNTGTVSGTGEWVFKGDIVGNGDRASNAYTSADGDLKKAATFQGFDFSENGAWRIYEDKTTPLLTAFLKDKDEVISSNVYDGSQDVGAYTVATTMDGTGITQTGDNAINWHGLSIITPATINVSFADTEKVYDGDVAVAAGTATLTGKVGNDDVSLATGLTANFEDKNVGNGKSVNYTNIALTGTKAGNYTLANVTAEGKGAITAKNITVSFADISKTYDGTTNATAGAGTLDGVESVDTGKVSVTASAAYADKNVGTGKQVDYTNVALTGDEAGNYTIAGTATGTGTITAKNITVSFADISKNYDGTTDAAAGTGTLQGVVSGDDVGLQDGIAAVYDSKNAGNRTVNYSGIAIGGADVGNYTIAATGTGTGVINPKELTASFADISKTYDGTITATAGEGTLTGVEAIDTGKVGVTASAAYADKNVGTGKQVDYTNVALTGDEAGNYTIAGTATGTGTITAKNITVSFADISKTYDGTTNATAGAGTLDGVEAVDTGQVSVTASAAYADKNAGTNKQVDYTNVALTGDEAGNYTIAAAATGTGVIIPKAITATFADISKTYDGTTSAVAGAGTLDGVEAVDTGKVSVTASAAYADKNAGTDKQVDYSNVTLTGTEAGNYTIANTATGNGQIDRANLTVSVKDYSREYDGATSASGAELQVTSGTLYAGDTISGGTKVFDTKAVGNGKTITVSEVTVSDSTGNANNYNISYAANTNSAITPKTLTVNFADISKTYDGTADAAAGEGTLQGVVAGEDVTLQDGIAAVYDSKNAGNRTVNYSGIAISGADIGNYTIAATGTGTGVINPKELTVGFADISKTYDGTTSAVAGAGTLDGVEAVDTGKVSVTASAAYADKNAGMGKQVDYTNVTLTGDEAGNYSIADTATGKGQIDRANLTVSVKDYSREYDGSISADGAELTVTSGTLYAGDSMSGGTKVFDTKDVGTGKTITVSEVAVKDSAGNANNYNISYAANTNSAITPKTLTVNFADISKTYDGTTNATAGAGILDGVEAVDTGKVSVTASATYADKNAGTNKQVDYTNVALTGDEAGNYTIAGTATGKGQINRANLTVSVKDYSREYDGITSASGAELQVTSGTLYAGDTISGGTKVFDTKDVGTGKTITVSEVAVKDSAGNANNYNISYAANTNSAITPKTLTVNFADISKTYDGTTNATAGAGILDGVEVVDTGKVSVTASAAYADKNAGTNKQVDYTNVILGGDEAGNYTIAAAATGTGVITPKAITATFADISKTYDGTTSAVAGAGTLDGVEAVDTGKVSVMASAAYADKNAGTDKQVDYSNVTLTGTEAGNYTIANTATGNGQIDRANLTVSVKDYSREYDGSTSASGAELQVTSGTLYAGDTISGGTKVFDTKGVGTGKTITVSEVTVSDSTGNANNYNISYAANTNSAITPKTLTVNFADISKTYDGTTNATAGAGTLDGVEAVDTGKVGVTASAAYADKNAGTNKQVDYTNVALTGDEAGNYTIVNTATGKGQIDRANLTVSVKDYSREYDGTTSASGAELQVTSGTLYAGDTISGGTKVFDTKDVGTGKTITISGVSINDGNNGDNYAVTYQPNTNSVITALPQPEPVNPQPGNPEPSKPEPVNPQPSNPEPSKPEPVNPQPSNPEPSKPEPVNPQPGNPEPSKPEPVNPQPSNPEPVNTEQSQEQQLAETGNTVADIEAATEKLGTEEVHEMKEKMAAPKHEALEVTDEKSGDDENEKKQSKK